MVSSDQLKIMKQICSKNQGSKKQKLNFIIQSIIQYCIICEVFCPHLIEQFFLSKLPKIFQIQQLIVIASKTDCLKQKKSCCTDYLQSIYPFISWSNSDRFFNYSNWALWHWTDIFDEINLLNFLCINYQLFIIFFLGSVNQFF